MSKQYPVITISREYAAGGRTVAKALASRLNIPWFDHDLAKIIAENSGYSEAEVLSEGEELSNSDRFLDFILNNANSYTSSHDAIFKAQKEEILRLAENPCIVVGRCSNKILQEAGIDSFDIFLYADKQSRLKRAEELTGYTGDRLLKYLEKRDVFRENYYKSYAKGSISNACDYNICLDTGLISYEKCVDIICEILG